MCLKNITHYQSQEEPKGYGWLKEMWYSWWGPGIPDTCLRKYEQLITVNNNVLTLVS